jgi:uncharacterized membrane protein YphA (DoxX/SURF4 family)
MSCATLAGTRLIPLLSRIVLGGAFFFAGWHACFNEVTFTPQEIHILEGGSAVPVQVSLEQTPAEPATPAAATPETPAASETPASGDPAADADPRPLGPFAKATPVEAGIMRAAAERITLQLRHGGVGEFSEPLAWAAAVASLVGGVLIFVGILTRFWAFTMAVMLGASFWFASVVDAGMFATDPFAWTSNPDSFNQMFSTLAFFVLALGLLLTGPGMLGFEGVFRSRMPVDPSTSLSAEGHDA